MSEAWTFQRGLAVDILIFTRFDRHHFLSSPIPTAVTFCQRVSAIFAAAKVTA